MNLGLGTAQFGLDYGIANKSGRLSKTEVGDVLALAAAHGTDIIDTASLYGESEQVLGDCLTRGHRFRIVTKTPHFRGATITGIDLKILRDAWRDSLRKLRAESLYGLLIHNADDLLKPGGEDLFAEMQRFKDQGGVAKIGFSVYSARQLDALAAVYRADLVQLPLNLFDQRLLKSGHLQRLKAGGSEIHVRSAFLQGLLLLAPEELPPSLHGLREHLRAYRSTLAEWRIRATQAPLWFLASIGEIDCVVCGIDSRKQFEELVQIAKSPHGCYDFGRFALEDENLLNPSLWKR